MLWLIYILLIFLGVLLKNSKLYNMSVVIFMGVLAYINTDSADYAGIYLRTYLNPTLVPEMDVGWVALCQFGSLLGLSYNAFAGVLTIASMTLLLSFARHVNANTSFMLALFLIYPGLMSIVQFRQFVASAIGAIALIALSTNMRGRYILFISLIYLASLVHRSAIILLIVLIWPMLSKAGKSGRIVLTLILAAGVAIALSNAEMLGSLVFGDFRTAAYLSASGGTTSASLLAGLRNAVLIAIMALSPYFCGKMAGDTNAQASESVSIFDSSDNRILRVIAFINIALIILVPFVFITNDFMRFERYGFTYSLALFSWSTEKKGRFILLATKGFYIALSIVFAISFVANTFDSVYGALLSFEYFPDLFL